MAAGWRISRDSRNSPVDSQLAVGRAALRPYVVSTDAEGRDVSCLSPDGSSVYLLMHVLAHLFLTREINS